MGESPHLFCIDLQNCPHWLILTIGAIGVFGSFLLHGLAHEKLYKYYHFSETVFLTFAQFLGYASLSLPSAIKLFKNRSEIKTPMGLYLLTSILLGLSMSLANYAALRLSYATEVLFKSSKLIPVMIGNIIFLKKKPRPTEVLSVCLIVCGLVSISLGDFKGKNKFNADGVIAVILSLCCDAIASNMEDKIMSVYGASQDEIITFLYGAGSILIGIVSIANGQMVSGIRRVSQDPTSLIYIFLFSFLGALGIQFVYLIMKVFGSLLTVMVTSLRKAMTVMMSFVVYKDKKFTHFHAFAIFMIASGISLNIYDKNRGKKKEEEIDEVEMLENNFVDVEINNKDTNESVLNQKKYYNKI
ncbi:adenosine 3'-phospho 5'-phosphosulfate transporter 2 isoform X1 [Histomonas meleagridis]|uniref:adenosine 3'-phospho 5'-phosphosulfate transporter 2 isoform X1 n=1 Tax=Histomonas meleagridis TaxID=135588 RepID=UPI00355A7B50|nr:adenosine 3'-phospho 5'-phosphosulfate transporter 2 isoform X1 [Histomonas meleagridis]KAH0802695.1 adenosine 3'-phospho 5'-phosphosulfate transporter 2 isoform X1 [Histomonas meleagridis]